MFFLDYFHHSCFPVLEMDKLLLPTNKRNNWIRDGLKAQKQRKKGVRVLYAPLNIQIKKDKAASHNWQIPFFHIIPWVIRNYQEKEICLNLIVGRYLNFRVNT